MCGIAGFFNSSLQKTQRSLKVHKGGVTGNTTFEVSLCFRHGLMNTQGIHKWKN